MILCYIAIGSNLADPVQQIQMAFVALNGLAKSRLVATSSLYASRPMGPPNQPDYINAVAALDTLHSPLALLNALQAIEQQQGRQRTLQRWGPRTLDLDLLLYDKQTIKHPRLTVPHEGITSRPFVLYPLFEIAPTLILPGGEHISDLITSIKDEDPYCVQT